MVSQGLQIDELEVCYPTKWADEYRRTGMVERWLREYPDLFGARMAGSRHPGRLAANLGQLDLFAQYGLQYILRSRHGLHSLTWYKLASRSPSPATAVYWNRMRELMMGDFDTLRNALIAKGFGWFTGEPDLFCWDDAGHWFFAEAKHRDKLTAKSLDWFRTCREALGERGLIRVYRLIPRRWHESAVDEGNDHFELRYGSAADSDWDHWIPVARVGLPVEKSFPVQFLVEPSDHHRARMIMAVAEELDYYLVTKREENPLVYAQYHCGTAANIYSSVHWSFSSASTSEAST